jgi:hypothetical protein
VVVVSDVPVSLELPELGLLEVVPSLGFVVLEDESLGFELLEDELFEAVSPEPVLLEGIALEP